MVSLSFFSPSPFLAWRRHSADPRTSRALHIHTRKSSEPSSSGSKKGGTKAQREREKSPGFFSLSFFIFSHTGRRAILRQQQKPLAWKTAGVKTVEKRSRARCSVSCGPTGILFSFYPSFTVVQLQK